MANEKLLLRKGTLANLASLPKTAGAISITTDVPGIYLDVSDTNRIRIGDFIAVSSLSDLSKVQGSLSTTALYYAEDTNVLCRYDGSKLVWINDTTALTTAINTVKGRVDAHDGLLTGLRTDVNTNTTNISNNATAITNEANRAKGIEGGLQDQINTIKGGSTDSIAALKQSIADLDAAYKTADTGLTNTINKIYGGSGVPASNPSTISGNASAITTINNKLKDIESGAQVNDIESIKITAGSLSTGEKTATSGTKRVDLTIPSKIEHLTDGTSTVTGLTNSINGVASDLSNLDGRIGYTASDKTTNSNKSFYDVYKAAVQALNTKDNELASSIGTTNTNLTNLTTRVTTAEGKITSNTTAITNEATNRATAINSLRTELQGYANTKDGELRTELTTLINDKMATADAMTFKGAIGFKSDGKTPNVPTGAKAADAAPLIHAGDTYVLSATAPTGSHSYHVGDLIIAVRDQTAAETSYPSGIVAAGETPTTATGWYHVKCGYDAVYESTLAMGTNSGVNVIQLKAHTGNVLSNIGVWSESDNVNIINSTKNGIAGFGVELRWADF